jgi:hypothetical protein
MTRFVRGLRLIQYIIVPIIFVKKVIILKFYQKLSHVFTNYLKCTWIYEINRFNSGQFL